MSVQAPKSKGKTKGMKIEPFDSVLVAPCGMNCAVCSAYLSQKNNIPKVRGKIHYCQGCRPRNKQCAFLKKKCADKGKLLKGKVEFCFECGKFPCDNLKRIDDVYSNNYGMSMLDNLNAIKKGGINKFIKSQCRKYGCKKCGALVSTHSGKCFACDKVKSWKD